MIKFFAFIGMLASVYYGVRWFYLSLCWWQREGRAKARKSLCWATLDQAVGDRPLHLWQRFFRWLNL